MSIGGRSAAGDFKQVRRAERRQSAQRTFAEHVPLPPPPPQDCGQRALSWGTSHHRDWPALPTGGQLRPWGWEGGGGTQRPALRQDGATP